MQTITKTVYKVVAVEHGDYFSWGLNSGLPKNWVTSYVIGEDTIDVEHPMYAFKDLVSAAYFLRSHSRSGWYDILECEADVVPNTPFVTAWMDLTMMWDYVRNNGGAGIATTGYDFATMLFPAPTGSVWCTRIKPIRKVVASEYS